MRIIACAVASSLLLVVAPSLTRADDMLPGQPPPSTTILPETSATLTIIGGAVAIPAAIEAPDDTGDGVGVVLGGAVGWLAVSGTTLALSLADPGPTYHDAPGAAATGLVFMTLGGSAVGVGAATLAADSDFAIGPAMLAVGGGLFALGAVPFALGSRSVTAVQVAEDERIDRLRANNGASSSGTAGKVLTGVGIGLMALGGILAAAAAGGDDSSAGYGFLMGGATAGTGLVCVGIGIPLWVSGAHDGPPPKLSVLPGPGSVAVHGDF